MKVATFALSVVCAFLLVGCGSSTPATNADAAAAAKEMNAANRGVQPQPDSDLMSAPPAGGAMKPHR